eukprot:TRINITY_DN14976_c0_g1_i1.p1 TRINITY_DN14976_c0_g1~~TRINITY_DN14976_c0_g1_i1.p1  ORF type:complete len:302 (+),score=76.78 TRINITY_DN14976_c0_g1_i1:220-1125(+)
MSEELVVSVLTQINEVNDIYTKGLKKEEYNRTTLKAILTLIEFDLPEKLIKDIDTLLQNERDLENEFSVEDIKPISDSSKIALWIGDITTLKIDAIVNAANSRMLGCFTPFHRCIDNIIHAKAGPKLREECKQIMGRQNHPEPTGKCKITKGYNLPSKYVLHTVGPIIPHCQLPNEEQAELLKSCYIECLNCVKEHEDIRSIAFCSISTGVFGYPEDLACDVVVDAVNEWLEIEENNDSLDLVIFNVFHKTISNIGYYQNKLNELIGRENPLTYTIYTSKEKVTEHIIQKNKNNNQEEEED